ncbi:MAG: polymerase sigma-70 factor [Myxococcales bacterium]|nr:polymerase sigma-70 factor [Myxococcales bacterium]
MLLPSYVAGKRWASVVDKGDVTLISGAAAGDRDCLAALYDRYAPALLAIGRRILGDRREAEDLLHDVFIEVWRQAADYDEARGSVRAWLLMRMRSRALDRRKAAVFSKRADLPAPEAVAATVGDAHSGEDPELGADRTAVRRALAELPAEQRQVLELGYFEGLSSSEIAERLRAPIGTVKSRVAAALTKLRQGLMPEASR